MRSSHQKCVDAVVIHIFHEVPHGGLEPNKHDIKSVNGKHVQWWIKDLSGMSDLCIYELQDNVWDEFNEIDDHIVPRPADDTGDKCTVQSGSHKKLRVEVDPTSSADCAKNFIVRGKREASSQILTKRDKMLIQGQWCCPSDGAQGDTVKEDTGMLSNDSTLTDNCFISGTSSGPCARDSIMGDPSMSVDNNLYDYHLSQISQSESSLNFFDNGDKESSDLYYGWPDIGNFEDVDKMFRGCDSTFGLGSLSNDTDLGWFSPSTAIEGSENALRSSSKISCSGSTLLGSDLENDRDYGPQRDDNSPDEYRKNFIGSYDTLRSHSTCIGEATSAENVQPVGGSEMKSESKEDSVPQEEMNLPTNQTELPNQLKGKKKEECLENAASLQRCSFSKPILDAKASHIGLSVQIPNFIAVDYHHQVSQVSECPSLPSIKCVNDSHLSPRLKDSSPASNQAWSTDPHGNSFEVPSGKIDGTVIAYNNHQLQSSKAGGLNHLDATSPAAISDPVAVLKRMHRSVNDSEAGLSAGVATGLDNSLAPETSSMSSMVDEISLEATSFRQLQQVMEKLDIKTKLCIRDSLYRLARSAEQRHNCLTPNIASNNEEARDGDIILNDSNKGSLIPLYCGLLAEKLMDDVQYRDDYKDRDYRRRSRSRSLDRDRYRSRDRDYHGSRSRSMSPDYCKERGRGRYDDDRRSRNRSVGSESPRRRSPSPRRSRGGRSRSPRNADVDD